MRERLQEIEEKSERQKERKFAGNRETFARRRLQAIECSSELTSGNKE
jgi:hypothetical protein